MKKPLITTLALLCCFYTYAQIVFEKGYVIDNANQKTECLIKNVDWKNNPANFEYKLTESSESKTATIKSIKEFGIYEVSKHKRFTVDIDRSSENIDDLSTTRLAQFQQEKLFLKVLVEGKATLYFYEDGNLTRFFYHLDNKNVKQLVFKRYKISNYNIGKNEDYKLQLLLNLKCQHIAKSYIENIDYKKNDLVDLFIKYNECNNSKFTDFKNKRKKDLFNLSIRAGLNSSSLNSSSLEISLYSPYRSRHINFDNKLALRVGVEAELIMPFNKNKWAVTIEPTYQYYNITKEGAYDIGTVTQDASVDYKSIELPVGIRHYLFINNYSKLFMNMAYVIDLSSNSKIDFEYRTDLEIKTSNNFALGIGYKQNDKYSLEFRYYTPRQVLSSYTFWTSNYNTISVILGYTIF